MHRRVQRYDDLLVMIGWPLPSGLVRTVPVIVPGVGPQNRLDAARNRYMGAVSLGYGPDGKRIRRKVSGKTKQEARARLQALHQEMDAGVKSSKTYTVREAVDDWLREGLDGTSEWTRTLYEGLLGSRPS